MNRLSRSSSAAALALVTAAGCASLSGLTSGRGDGGDEVAARDAGVRDAKDTRDRQDSAPPCSDASCSGTCSNGRCTTFIAGRQYETTGMVATKDAVFWVTSGPVGIGAGALMKLDLATHEVTTLAGSQNSPQAVAVDETSVYWVNDATEDHDGTVTKIALAGGQVTTLATHRSSPAGVAVDGASVYVCEPQPDDGVGGGILRLPVDGGAVVTLAADADCTGIATASGSVYWMDETTYALAKMSTSGGAITTLAVADQEPQALSVYGAWVYWADSGGAIARVPASGGAKLTLAPTENDPVGIAADSTGLYWTDYGDLVSTGAVMFAGEDAGAIMTLSSGIGAPHAIALGSSAVYFGDDDDLTVDSVPKP